MTFPLRSSETYKYSASLGFEDIEALIKCCEILHNMIVKNREYRGSTRLWMDKDDDGQCDEMDLFVNYSHRAGRNILQSDVVTSMILKTSLITVGSNRI